MKVILNVGHGGVKRDPGACGNGFEEHAWNKDFVNNYIVPECKEQGVDYVVIKIIILNCQTRLII